jgi:hypothetical protein
MHHLMFMRGITFMCRVRSVGGRALHNSVSLFDVVVFRALAREESGGGLTSPKRLMLAKAAEKADGPMKRTTRRRFDQAGVRKAG